MMELSLDKPEYLLLLIPVALIAWAGVAYLAWRKRAVSAFAEPRFLNYFGIKKTGSAWIILPVILSLVLMVVSLAAPLGGSEKIKMSQSVSNVIYALDVSNSMNAEDVAPNRLEVAKSIILSTMEKNPGDRVGLIVFAGNAFSLMPLTTDQEAAKVYLKGLTTSVIKVQGTDFMMPVQISADKFKAITSGARQLVIVSDGEDNEGQAGEAANFAKSQNITIHTVGVGKDEGAPIPEYEFGQLMGYKADVMGNTVLTKRETGVLKDLSSETGGTYIDADNPQEAVNTLSEVLHRNKAGSEVMLDSKNQKHYYQYLLGAGFLLLLIVYLFNRKRDLNL